LGTSSHGCNEFQFLFNKYNKFFSYIGLLAGAQKLTNARKKVFCPTHMGLLPPLPVSLYAYVAELNM